jgi:hypothetical protein
VIALDTWLHWRILTGDVSKSRLEITFCKEDKMTQLRFHVCVAIVAALLATGCRRNHAPQIVSITANPTQVRPGGALQLNAVAVDQDKDSLSYQWMASGGFLSSSQGGSVTWKAPDSIGTYAVRLKVVDKAKGSDTGSVQVTVAANMPPGITRLSATPLILNPRGSCAVSVTASDPEGRGLKYLWSANNGRFSDSAAASTGWTGPPKSGQYSLKVAVTDSEGLSASDSVMVEVRKADKPDVAAAPEPAVERVVPPVEPTTPEEPMPPEKQSHNVIVVNDVISVGAGSYHSYRVTVTSEMEAARVVGRFTASGGSGNDIVVLVMGSEAYTNFCNGHQVNVYYNSGQVTTGTIDVSNLEPGTYHIVFSNQFSSVTTKSVSAQVAFVYLQ